VPKNDATVTTDPIGHVGSGNNGISGIIIRHFSTGAPTIKYRSLGEFFLVDSPTNIADLLDPIKQAFSKT
jgi:hypothetical protein